MHFLQISFLHDDHSLYIWKPLLNIQQLRAKNYSNFEVVFYNRSTRLPHEAQHAIAIHETFLSEVSEISASLPPNGNKEDEFLPLFSLSISSNKAGCCQQQHQVEVQKQQQALSIITYEGTQFLWPVTGSVAARAPGGLLYQQMSSFCVKVKKIQNWFFLRNITAFQL